MRRTEVSLGEMALIASTRAMAGAGVALLCAHRLPAHRRRTMGWMLLLIGAASTVPLALDVFGRSRRV